MATRISDERFAFAQDGELITWGIMENGPDGIFMTHDVFPVIWGMWKGRGGDDWAIYVKRFDPRETWAIPLVVYLESVHDTGDKVLGHSVISRIVEVSENLYNKYRY